MKIHKKSEIPKQVKGEPFSVDVITYDKNGLVNIGFYNYDSRTWGFHLDTMYDDNTRIEFVWIYPPIKKMKKAWGKQKYSALKNRICRLMNLFK